MPSRPRTCDLKVANGVVVPNRGAPCTPAACIDRNRIHTANPAARVVLLGLYNPYRTAFLDEQVALWDSRLIARFARDREVDVVRIADLFTTTARLSPIDHFHPSAEGYALIAARVAATW